MAQFEEKKQNKKNPSKYIQKHKTTGEKYAEI